MHDLRKEMNRTNIIVITSSHPVFDTRIFKKECHSLTHSLTDAGFKVILLAPIEEKLLHIEGVTIIGFGKITNRVDRIFNLLKIFLLMLRLNGSVFHVHEPELLLLLPFVRIFMRHSKFFYDVHENYSDAVMSSEKHWIPDMFKPLIAHLLNFIEKFLARQADLVIAASPDIEVNFIGCKTISVRNFAPMYIIDRILRDKELQQNTKSFEIIYTGSLTRTRGILEIVKALEMLEPNFNVKFIVSGIFHDSQYKKEVEAQPGFKNMSFLGWIPSYEDMIKRIINADIAMICFHSDPNLDDAVERSNKLFEYMGMGLPIIVSDLPGWSGLINKFSCGVVVNPLDPADIADKINYLLNNPDVARQMGQNGRETVLKNYNWQIEGDKLVSAYKKIL